MNIRLTILLVLIVCKFANSQTESDEKLYNRFEIYFVEEFVGSQSSYWDFNKKELRQFKKEYKKTTKIPDSICHWFIDLEKSQIKEKPFLNESDIEYYSPKNFKIKLTKSGKEKMSQLKANTIPVSGKPFIIVANEKKLIGAWFWSRYSSYLCDRIYSLIDEETELFELSFLNCGNDPRKEMEFINELTEIK